MRQSVYANIKKTADTDTEDEYYAHNHQSATPGSDEGMRKALERT
jgi:hypothetical protein